MQVYFRDRLRNELQDSEAEPVDDHAEDSVVRRVLVVHVAQSVQEVSVIPRWQATCCNLALGASQQVWCLLNSPGRAHATRASAVEAQDAGAGFYLEIRCCRGNYLRRRHQEKESRDPRGREWFLGGHSVAMLVELLYFYWLDLQPACIPEHQCYASKMFRFSLPVHTPRYYDVARACALLLVWAMFLVAKRTVGSCRPSTEHGLVAATGWIHDFSGLRARDG